MICGIACGWRRSPRKGFNHIPRDPHDSLMQISLQLTGFCIRHRVRNCRVGCRAIAPSPWGWLWSFAPRGCLTHAPYIERANGESFLIHPLSENTRELAYLQCEGILESWKVARCSSSSRILIVWHHMCASPGPEIRPDHVFSISTWGTHH